MLKPEFLVELIIIFVKSIKKGIEWYIHFIQKPVILFAINLANFTLDVLPCQKTYSQSKKMQTFVDYRLIA